MKNYQKEFNSRVQFIREIVERASAKGIIFGNSGGKDCALVGILCKKACENTVGVIMPCASSRNYGEDKNDADLLAEQFGIETRVIDLTETRNNLNAAIGADLNTSSISNIAPRLRMTTLYTIAANENLLVAGTGNFSEIYMGYFTKWGDGAYDFNPIADLTVTEVFDFLRFLNAPRSIITKVPSAGLFEGQTDETEMGISYEKIDEFLLYGDVSDDDYKIIEAYNKKTEHKRHMPIKYKG